MPMIEVTEEELAFLRKTAANLQKQDNHMTGDPYYYMVRTWKKLVLPSGHGDEEVRYSHDCSEEFESFEKFVAFMIREQLVEPIRYDEVWGDEDECKEPVDVPVYDMEALEKKWEEMEEFSTKLEPEYHNVFLTEAAFQEHMRLNGHNYRSSKDKVDSYVKHAFRNPELRDLVRFIRRVGTPQTREDYQGKNGVWSLLEYFMHQLDMTIDDIQMTKTVDGLIEVTISQSGVDKAIKRMGIEAR